ncbi:MAG: FAD-binding oxidoreductase [Candidatus Thermoplasmatota archaeon]|jgi:D-lactate dehydrogenase (cytochrome)|nr:FAD-binding oxidoreductase [Candidatus Thermoplasmatota archaeon]MCL5963716.1 FAD-binding oxidoreductase [Candidatus Thermoplasmatota archaeon]
MNHNNIIRCEKIDTENININDIENTTDKNIIERYLSDESAIFKGNASKIYFPKNELELIVILKEANKLKIHVTVSGAGTGLNGARVPFGGIIISTENMITIKHELKNKEQLIEWEENGKNYSIIIGSSDNSVYYAIVPPGLPLYILNKMIEPMNLFYPPQPTEKGSYIGGNVATNASGARTYYYGTTREWINRLKIILPKGDLIDVKRGWYRSWNNQFNILTNNGTELILNLFSHATPDVKKNVAGLYIKPDMDFIDLFIGSEGILGIFTEIELKLIKQPGYTSYIIADFINHIESMKAIANVKKMALSNDGSNITVIEFFDENSIDFIKKFSNPVIPNISGSVVIFEIQSDDEDKLYDRLTHLNTILNKYGIINSYVATEYGHKKKIEELRHSLPDSINKFLRRYGTNKIATDIAVPDKNLYKMYSYYEEVGSMINIPYVIYGHIGDNHLHFNFLPKNRDEVEKASKAIVLLLKKAVSFGGTVTAEHGIGKKNLLSFMYDKNTIEKMKIIKKTIDPDFILNKNNIFGDENEKPYL